ncbi:hypothetical protein V4U86_22145 [Mycobacterium sp. AMU20-3851]
MSSFAPADVPDSSSSGPVLPPESSDADGLSSLAEGVGVLSLSPPDSLVL